MKTSREKIFQFVLKLQAQKQVPLWSLANESVIYAAAISEEPKWGAKTQILQKIMSIAYKFKISDVVIFFVGIMRAFIILGRIKKNKNKIKHPLQYKKIFAGFGASSEEYLYEKYLIQSQDLSLRVNWVTLDGLEKLDCPSILSIIVLLFQNAFGYTANLKCGINEIKKNKVDFLTICALNIGLYAFYRCYWKKAKLAGITEVTFLAMDILAFACADEFIKTIYLQHGLMSRAILFPDLYRIDALSFDEAKYLKALLKNVSIHYPEKITLDEGPRNNVLILMSLNVFQEERLLICESLIQWAEKMELKIVLRQTKKVSEMELAILKKKIPSALVDGIDKDLQESFKRWRPKLVSAWSSTGLSTALEQGCLPISLYDPAINEVWDKMVYPMKNKVLFWPRDKYFIQEAIQSDVHYKMHFECLQSYQEDYSHLDSLSLTE